VVPAKLPAALFTLAALAAPRPASAQQRLKVRTWERVRVTAPSAGLDRTIATVVSRSAHDITLRLGDPERSRRGGGGLADVKLLLDSVRSMEVSIGVGRSHAGIGAAIGFFSGFAVGYIVGKSQPPNKWFFDATGAFAVEGALLGGLAGALIGSAIRPEHWRRVALHYHPVTVVGLQGGRLGIGASLAF
jgi:hypothetical protein